MNIAEGCGRGGDLDFARFLQIAMGSASELEYQMILAKDLKYLEITEFYRLAESVEEIKKMLASFIAKLRADS